jgi:hypothetical protein
MSLLDASGCLSAAGIAAVSQAVPGQIAPEVAAHLASCPRCQERLLAGDVPRAPRRERPAPPSIKRALALLGLILMSILVFFLTLRQLTG